MIHGKLFFVMKHTYILNYELLMVVTTKLKTISYLTLKSRKKIIFEQIQRLSALPTLKRPIPT
jgi:hypothetical protein